MTRVLHAPLAAQLRAVPRPRGWARRRRGAALIAMLMVVVLLAFLSLALVRVSHGDFRRARDARLALAAREGADLAAHSVLRDWATSGGDTSAVGAVLTPVSWNSALGHGAARTMRTSRTTFWTVGDGWAGDSLARSLSRAAVNVAWRLAVPDIITSAALTVRDSVSLVGSARVVGNDTTLAAWGASCPLPTPAPAVALPDTTRLCDGMCGIGSVGGRARGLPPLVTDPQASLPSHYDTFGAEDWSTLAAHASIVLPAGSIVNPAPVVRAGACDRAAPGNWGDPVSGGAPCAQWMPIIWARGDIELRGGVGQGLLIADGDVTLSAGALFAGVIIARDDIIGAGAGGTVLGAALAGDARVASADHTRLEGATLIQRSTCAIERALVGSARLRRVRDRSWAALR